MHDLKQLFGDLVRLEIELWDALDVQLRERCDVGLGTFQALQVIGRTHPCRVYDIVQALSITVGGASKTVDRIEKSGRCVRRANPDDRRSSIIELTPAGEQVLAAATVVLESELEARVGAALSADELTGLGEAIDKLRAANAAR